MPSGLVYLYITPVTISNELYIYGTKVVKKFNSRKIITIFIVCYLQAPLQPEYGIIQLLPCRQDRALFTIVFSSISR